MGSLLNSTQIKLVKNDNTYLDAPESTSDFIYLLDRLRIKLLQDLQSSLEIGDIINLFLKGLKTLLPLEGISYCHQTQQLEYKTEKQGKHHATYHLETENEKMGDLIFSRNQRFKENELNIFEELMSCLLYPLLNALKYERALKAASTDALTGSGNRNSMESAISRAILFAKRNGKPPALIMLDFDHFKKINDCYGHQCGDYVLKQVITEVQNSLRETDLVFRYGGEEFAVLLHHTNQEGAKLVAEKIRQCIENLQLEFNDWKPKVTLSLGISTMKEGDNITSLINRADQALYTAKHDGRNCVKYIT